MALHFLLNDFVPEEGIENLDFSIAETPVSKKSKTKNYKGRIVRIIDMNTDPVLIAPPSDIDNPALLLEKKEELGIFNIQKTFTSFPKTLIEKGIHLSVCSASRNTLIFF